VARTVDATVRWGILGTGKIARIIATALAESRDATLVAVGSRTADRSRSFASEFGVPRAHATYEGVIDDDDVDLVYVATHHPSHREVAVAAAEAGKHVLCEKPMAVNAMDATAIVDAARRNDVFLLEAFAYRCHPQTQRLRGLLRDGAIGEIRMVDTVFGYDAGPKPENYLLVRELAGGGILDVGCYTTSMAHLVAAASAGIEVAETTHVAATARFAPSGVDRSTAATMTFETGLLARVACSIEADLEGSVRIYGSEGRITIPSPWLPGRVGSAATIAIERRGTESNVIDVPLDEGVYTTEVNAVDRFVRSGERSPLVMRWDESLANMRTLDRWRAAIGLRYDDDERG
jgi:predicted dehydrogenase